MKVRQNKTTPAALWSGMHPEAKAPLRSGQQNRWAAGLPLRLTLRNESTRLKFGRASDLMRVRPSANEW